jgi:hypothetical protein
VLDAASWGEGGGRVDSGGERQQPWMLVEVRSQSENNGKWKRDSGAVEGGRVWVAFIGLSNIEMWRWRGGSAVDSGRHFNVSIM